MKVKEIFSLAGLSIGVTIEKPKVVGAVNNPGLEKYKKFGIDFSATIY